MISKRPMQIAEDTHYLRTELYELIQDDPVVFDFLQNAMQDGIWYWDLINPEHEWMSPEFWRVLGYSPQQKQHLASEWQELIHPDDLELAPPPPPPPPQNQPGKTSCQSRPSLRSGGSIHQETGPDRMGPLSRISYPRSV